LRPIRAALETPLTIFYATVVSKLMGALGVGHAREGATRRFAEAGFDFVVEPVCTGYFVFWFYLGAVLAFPAGWLARAAAVGLGMALPFVLNVVRILSHYYARVAHPRWFDEVHLVAWQVLTIVLIGVFWYGWASTRPADGPAAA